MCWINDGASRISYRVDRSSFLPWIVRAVQGTMRNQPAAPISPCCQRYVAADGRDGRLAAVGAAGPSAAPVVAEATCVPALDSTRTEGHERFALRLNCAYALAPDEGR